VVVVGVSGVFGHDAAAAVVVDGRLVAAVEEERFTRRRHAPGALPVTSILWALNHARRRPEEVDAVAFSWDPEIDPTNPKLRDYATAVMTLPVWAGWRPKEVFVEHHTAHAAAAWRPARPTPASVVVVDGNGEQWGTSIGIADHDGIRFTRRWGVRDSLGHMYTRVTEHLGLGSRGEGKLMGLAAYGVGDPLPILDQAEVQFSLPEVAHLPAKDRYAALGQAWHTYLDSYRPRASTPWRWDSHRSCLSTPAVGPEVADLAASTQATLEAALHRLVDLALAESGSRDLVLAGGVALNCAANGTLSCRDDLDRIHLNPACGDAGAAIGAAWVASEAGGGVRADAFDPFLGPRPATQCLEQFGLRSLPLDREQVADLLVGGAVLGRCAGRAEIGPRALGNRSILARPDSVDVRDRVNRIKGRAPWRPLAPVVVDRDLVGGGESPHMLFASQVRDRIKLAGVTHVDGTTRPQTLDSRSCPDFAALLAAFENRTGLGALMNTSLNVGGEPMVLSAVDAVRTFYGSGLDGLLIEDRLLVKR